MTIDKPSAEVKLAEVTDKIVAMTMVLQPLCSDSSGLPSEARRIVREVCETLHSAKDDLVGLLDPFARQRETPRDDDGEART